MTGLTTEHPHTPTPADWHAGVLWGSWRVDTAERLTGLTGLASHTDPALSLAGLTLLLTLTDLSVIVLFTLSLCFLLVTFLIVLDLPP